MAYYPPQRPITARVLSLGRWLRGTFHPAKMHAFDDHLANGRTFFTLTSVELGGSAPVPFLALRASATQAVVPEVPAAELLLQPPSGTAPRDVSCYLEHLAIHGRLELRAGVRTSDFLAHQDGFIVLRGCSLVPPLDGRAEPVPVVLVNARAIVALAEIAGGE